MPLRGRRSHWFGAGLLAVMAVCGCRSSSPGLFRGQRPSLFRPGMTFYLPFAVPGVKPAPPPESLPPQPGSNAMPPNSTDPRFRSEPLPESQQGPLLEPPESQQRLIPGGAQPRPATPEPQARWQRAPGEPRLLPGLPLPKLGGTPGLNQGVFKNWRRTSAAETAPAAEPDYTQIPQRTESEKQPVALGGPDEQHPLRSGHTPLVPPAEGDGPGAPPQSQYNPFLPPGSFAPRATETLPSPRGNSNGLEPAPGQTYRQERLPLPLTPEPDVSVDGDTTEPLPLAPPTETASPILPSPANLPDEAAAGPAFLPAPAPFGRPTAPREPAAGVPAAAAPATLPGIVPSSARQDEVLSEEFALANVTFCEAVRGFRDVVPANAQSLTAGQSVQVYGELRNFHCQPTSEGFRTQTYSVAEICSLQGKVYARQPLGTAADLSATEPKSYCLTHDITLPSRLPPGDYVLNLQVYDLVGRQVTQTELPFSVR